MLCLGSTALSPLHPSPCRMETQGSPQALVLSAHPCEGCGVTPCFIFCAFHLPLLTRSCLFLWPRAALFCPPFLPPLLSWVSLVYVYIFFTGLSPSFCLIGTAFSTILLLPFYASYIQIAQYITKYHPVTLSHTHLLLLLFEAAALCKQGGG